jgi:lipopolysaccharide/colanic/teichoic acid biosynthesis glycosyltransferase/GT2 family glycosyltransferase
MLSVIVPAYNAAGTLEACLDALEHQTVRRERYEVIVVDDGSSDRTAGIAQAHGARLIQQANAGPAAARNRGARAAQGDLLLFTDADCAPAPDWLERISAPFSDAEVVGAKGVYRTEQRSLVARFVQLEYERKYRRMGREEHIDFVDTYSAAYRRDVFLANGGFETLFPTSSVEDQELSFRLARKGYRLVFVPDAVVYHVHDVTVLEYVERKLTIGLWKALLLRWHPERALRDSHTPQLLKLQLILTGLTCLALLAAPLWTQAWWVALALLALFLGSSLPLLGEIARKDPAVIVLAPLLLLLRAISLGTGLAAGFVRFYGADSGERTPISGANRLVKRSIDVVGSVVGLVVAAPLLAALAAAVKVSSPGPAFFVQERAGENGRPFRLVKLRTMVEGAEKMAPCPEEAVAADPATWKREDDPRITRVGRILRRTSLDELPQLWNVLKGEMSLVGPRPEQLAVVRGYNDWHRQRLAVKPGLTGPMQVNGRADLELDERVRLELDYIDHYSLRRDLGILARTVVVVVSGRGAR